MGMLIAGKTDTREKKRGSIGTQKENRKARKSTTSYCKQSVY